MAYDVWIVGYSTRTPPAFLDLPAQSMITGVADFRHPRRVMAGVVVARGWTPSRTIIGGGFHVERTHV